MATIKKAQNSYQTNPVKKAKEDNLKKGGLQLTENEKVKRGITKLVPLKKKMKNGGSLSGLKASGKRVGPVDPKGAWTKVQEKTLAGAKGKAKLTADKQLGATKMSKKK